MNQGSEISDPTPAVLTPGLLLASRYRIEGPVPERGPAVFHGVDEDGQKPLLAYEIESAGASLLTPAIRVSHAHLARLFAVVKLSEESQRSAVVAERVEGQSLGELLQEIGKKAHVDAVRSALRVADALSALHAAGGAHGGINERTVIVQPRDHAAPMLVFGPRNPLSSPYRRPSDGEAPSEADDSWATAALLYHMLTGHPPPREGIETTDDLDLTELDDPALCEALAHGLSRDEERRSLDLRQLKRELARWFVDHAREEAVPVPTRTSQPPPLPPGSSTSTPPPPPSAHLAMAAVPALTSSTARPARKPSRRLSMLAGAGIVLGFGAAWALSAYRNRPRVEFVEVNPKAAAQAGATKEIDLSEVPVTGETEVATGDKLATCVAGYLPKGAFDKPPVMAPLCDETDPRAGGSKLRAAVVGGARPGSPPSEAMKLVSRLGWYEMATFAVIRAGCCPEAKPISLPPPSKSCSPMDAALRELGKAAVNGQSYEQPLKAYSEAVACEVRNGRAPLYRRTAAPQGGEEAAFSEFVKSVQTP
jgi:serine/threonine protein kinase